MECNQTAGRPRRDPSTETTDYHHYIHFRSQPTSLGVAAGKYIMLLHIRILKLPSISPE